MGGVVVDAGRRLVGAWEAVAVVVVAWLVEVVWESLVLESPSGRSHGCGGQFVVVVVVVQSAVVRS